MILVSVDDHLVEPPDMFDEHVPLRFRDRVPTVEHTNAGDDVWVFNGEVIPNIGLNAVAGRPKDEYGVEPTAFDEIRRGCWDIDERVLDMDAGGVLASLNFPSFPGFSARLFAACDDKELALGIVRAYNDWHVDEWAGAHPGRIIPQALPVLWDPELCADEMSRSRCQREGPAGSPTSSNGSTGPMTCTTSGRARTSATGCRATSSANTS